ncbi:hypothetical protein GGI12_006014 [Dipsacomyces acuminosporus]|nr:hypothetical protein GGI12_006014 [Dipsacomyces acuminosporus]
MVDNTALLTSGDKIYARKRKAKKEQVEEVSFDPKARRSFLTGFHKRKVQRRENAIAQIKAREREDRLELRKERREQQQELLAQKIRENKEYYGIVDSGSSNGSSESGGDDDGDDGDDSAEEDDDKDVSVLRGDDSVTTVTVTKDFDPTNIDDEEIGLERKLTPQTLASNLERQLNKARRRNGEDGGSGDENNGPAKKQPKKKTKKFRYETKAKRHERTVKERGKTKKRGGRK